MAMMGEEQKKALKFKIMVGVILAVIAGVAFSLSTPGLEYFLAKARAKKTETWAPKWYLRVALIMEWTGRTPRAMEIYEEFYLTYSGNEDRFRPLDRLMTEYEVTEENRYFMPWIASRYNRDNPRPPWNGGENAQPHALLPVALLAMAKHFERHRDYPKSDHIYRAVFVSWPDTQYSRECEKAFVRFATRQF